MYMQRPMHLFRTGNALCWMGQEQLSHVAVAVPQDAGTHATQTSADREANASSLVPGKSASACVCAHLHSVFLVPLPSHSVMPFFPRCPQAQRSVLPLLSIFFFPLAVAFPLSCGGAAGAVWLTIFSWKERDKTGKNRLLIFASRQTVQGGHSFS